MREWSDRTTRGLADFLKFGVRASGILIGWILGGTAVYLAFKAAVSIIDYANREWFNQPW